MSRKYDNLIWIPSPEEIERERNWINREILHIGLPTLENLARRASEARNIAYTPYSKYPVGAALLRISGKEETGQNIEVVTYSETGHAEEQAAKNAVSKGAIHEEGRRFIRAIAVSHEGDTAPCGRCRQIITEFCDNALVLIADTEGNIKNITSIKILLPYAFTPSDLGIKQ